MLYFHEAWSKCPPHVLIILTKFHECRANFRDFLFMANFWASSIFSVHILFKLVDIFQVLLNIIFLRLSKPLFQNGNFTTYQYQLLFQVHIKYVCIFSNIYVFAKYVHKCISSGEFEHLVYKTRIATWGRQRPFLLVLLSLSRKHVTTEIDN